MRIAFVCGFAWEPKGTVRLRSYPLAVELVNRGHEVTMFLTPYDNPAESGKVYTREGVHIQNLAVGNIPGLGYAALLIRLCRAIDHLSPDVVHIVKPKGFAGAACSYLLLKGFRSIALDCDDWEGWGGWNDIKDYPWIIKKYIDLQEKSLIRRVPVVTVASRALESRAAELRKSSKGVFYIPNCGVSAKDIEAQERARGLGKDGIRRSFNLPDQPIIFYNGHFEPGDDIMFFCRAAAPVARRTGSTIVFVGDGPDLPAVQRYFSCQQGVAVRFFPRLPYEQFIQLVAACDVAAFPYPDNPLHRSKCSTRIIDYMTMARAVLTTAVGQNAEYIVNGESGILAPPDDEVRFGKELQILLCDPELRARLGRNAERRVKREFSWNRGPVETCLDAYRCLLRVDVPISAAAIKSS
ncbi:MAG: glycosyltransferase family 4 protein [Candidatus Acidiferrales bacterium]|jgi:glycosyltransferase involved in cell wall biosynthesis